MSTLTKTKISSNNAVGTALQAAGGPTWSPNGKKIAWSDPNVNGSIAIYDYASAQTTDYKIANYEHPVYEMDWSRGTGLPDVSVECTAEVGKTCTTTVPEFCQNSAITNPVNGSSQIADGSVTYTPNGNKADEENYINLRQDLFGNQARCFIKIKFIPKTPATGEDNSLKKLLPLIVAAGAASSFGVIQLYRRRHGA